VWEFGRTHTVQQLNSLLSKHGILPSLRPVSLPQTILLPSWIKFKTFDCLYRKCTKWKSNLNVDVVHRAWIYMLEHSLFTRNILLGHLHKLRATLRSYKFVTKFVQVYWNYDLWHWTFQNKFGQMYWTQ
jgi:hypothetical protein